MEAFVPNLKIPIAHSLPIKLFLHYLNNNFNKSTFSTYVYIPNAEPAQQLIDQQLIKTTFLFQNPIVKPISDAHKPILILLNKKVEPYLICVENLWKSDSISKRDCVCFSILIHNIQHVHNFTASYKSGINGNEPTIRIAIIKA